MGTISINERKEGLCPIDKHDVNIEIEYMATKIPGDNIHNMECYKTKNNNCRYLSEGKCNLKYTCPIWEEAPKVIKKDLSDKKW